jgi:hypothetical protein
MENDIKYGSANSLLGILHLREASNLLKEKYPSTSLTLLELAHTIATNEEILEKEISHAEEFGKTLVPTKNGKL